MFRFPILKPSYFFYNQKINDFCLVLTKESINKYTKKIEDSHKNKDMNLLINFESNVSKTNPNPNNNNPYIIISFIGLCYFASIFYFFYKSKGK